MAQGNFSRARIEAYLGRRFTGEEITISNSGQADSVNYISFWKDGLEKSQPTEEQLIALKTEGDAIVKSNQAINARRNAYGDIGDQLDLLYKDIVAGKLDTTGEWTKKIKAVKDDNPKE